MIRAALSFFCLCVTCAGIAHGQNAPPPDDRARFARWFYQDAAALVFEKAAPHAPRYAVQGLLLLVPASLADKPLNDYVEDGAPGLWRDVLNATNDLGGPRVAVPATGLFAVSLVTSNTRFQDAAFTSLEALVYAGGVSYAVKYAIGRERPEDTSSPYRLRPFSGNTSFPSGHATQAFAVLTPWALYYPHPVTYGLVVVLGGGTAFSRIARERHWFTDVVGGAALGVVTAQYLVHRHREEGRGDAGVSVGVVPGPEGMQLRAVWRW